MQYRRPGHSDLRVSILGLGASGLGTRADLSESQRILDCAWDAGITLIDTANFYGRGSSESAIVTWLPQHRSEVIIATKAGLPVGDAAHDRGASRSHLTRELEGSLRRLRTDYIDLTCIRCIPSIRGRPSMKRYRPCRPSRNKARCVASEPPITGPGN